MAAVVSSLLLFAGPGCDRSDQPTGASLNHEQSQAPTGEEHEQGGDSDASASSTDVATTIAHRGDGEFVTSDACRKCHPQAYSTWHATYHRTMTQEPLPANVRGRFDGELIEVDGLPAQPFRQGDRFYITVIHPAWDAQEVAAGRDPRDASNPPPMTYAVDRLIGSHHQQVYLSKGPDGSYHTLPLVWSITHQRWITRGASFLTEPQPSFYHMTKMWNTGCIFCHNTGPDPGLRQATASNGRVVYSWESEVEELGIACEACHGPGGRHVELQESLQATATQPSDQQIVNPNELSKEASVLVCARCHGKMIAKQQFDRQCLVEGDFFRSGQWDFVEKYDFPDYGIHAAAGTKSDFSETEEGRYFWRDGTPRTTALEYQGLLLSACYQQGEMTCLSCHGMHGTEPNDQLLFGDSPHLTVAEQNRACTQCHQEFSAGERLVSHTHHPAESSGSLCYNCHMPYQAYSLLKRVRSHRISNPTVAATKEAGLPNACNQCHVDRSPTWAGHYLAGWSEGFTQKLIDADPRGSDESEMALMAAHLLSGHALQRALAAEQLGDATNFEIAGTAWRPPLLVEALEDEYDAVRLLGYLALRQLPGFEDLEYDYLGSTSQRAIQVMQARQIVSAQQNQDSQARLREVLGAIQSDQEIDDFINKQVERRPQTAIQVLE